MISNKRTLDSFFNKKPPPPPSSSLPSSPQHPTKKPRLDTSSSNKPPSSHPTYPFPIPHLPPSLSASLAEEAPALEHGKRIADQPHLDLVYFHNYIPKLAEAALFEFLRENLFFYRVQYKIRRGPVETQINTPRYTTVFGVDESSYFGTLSASVSASKDGCDDGNGRVNGSVDGSANDSVDDDNKVTGSDDTPTLTLLDRKTNRPVPRDRYKCRPRPIPACLAYLQNMTEASTGQTYNFCLVNYYANGNDSISYHSDDERFLGVDPAIASYSLGARRDFLMKHKPFKVGTGKKDGGGGGGGDGEEGGQSQMDAKPLKLTLNSGDMVLMRGATQANWLHSIPKRKGGESDKGRINITFRKAMVRGGTENYYQYNVGVGGAFKWDRAKRDMVPWVA